MRNVKKYCALMSSSLLLAFLVPMTCFARDKIEEISLNFSADLNAGTEWPSMEISGDEEGYSIDDFYFQTDSSEKYPQGVVTLLADDDHYFGTIKSADCELEGEGARFVKAVKKTGSQLNLTVSFHDMGADSLEDPSGLTWGQGNIASWAPVPGAKHYEVRLMKDGKSVFAQSAETAENSYDFSPMINQAGNYSFRVRAVSRYHQSTVSQWIDSPICRIDEAGTGSYSNSQTTDAQFGDTTQSDANAQDGADTPGHWVFDQDSWYWEYPDGSRAASQWIFYDNGWYYLNADSRMASGWTWIAGADGISRCYCFSEDPLDTVGKLYTNTVTPDGSFVNSDGASMVNGIVQTR